MSTFFVNIFVNIFFVINMVTPFTGQKKILFEAEFDFYPRAYFFSKDFTWKEFLWRVEEVSIISMTSPNIDDVT